MTRVLILVMTSAITTFLIRSTPFFFFSKKELPDLVKYFGKYLPFALMPLLVVFALRNINILEYPFGLPEIIASLSVIILHAKFKKLFLSISLGTFIYMVLIQLVFVSLVCSYHFLFSKLSDSLYISDVPLWLSPLIALSHLCLFLFVWPWKSYLTSLCPFFTYVKMGI